VHREQRGHEPRHACSTPCQATMSDEVATDARRVQVAMANGKISESA